MGVSDEIEVTTIAIRWAYLILERPGNFSGLKANFKIKTLLVQFLAHKPVNFKW